MTLAHLTREIVCYSELSTLQTLSYFAGRYTRRLQKYDKIWVR